LCCKSGSRSLRSSWSLLMTRFPGCLVIVGEMMAASYAYRAEWFWAAMDLVKEPDRACLSAQNLITCIWYGRRGVTVRTRSRVFMFVDREAGHLSTWKAQPAFSGSWIFRYEFLHRFGERSSQPKCPWFMLRLTRSGRLLCGHLTCRQETSSVLKSRKCDGCPWISLFRTTDTKEDCSLEKWYRSIPFGLSVMSQVYARPS
jgi:hypothetical protein